MINIMTLIPIWKRGIIQLTFIILLVGCTSSSKENPLFIIADEIVQQTVFDLPDTTSGFQPSRYNLWIYPNFMVLEGMDALGEVTGKEQYATYKDRNIDFFAEFQSKFGHEMTDDKGYLIRRMYISPVEMHHCGMIAAFPERQFTYPTEEKERGMAIFDTFLEQAPRLKDGTLVRMKSDSLGLGVQIDDLYMITPYWCRKGELLNDPKWLDRAIEEALRYHKFLWDEDDQLMHCLWLEQNKAPYGLYWGRGNGWYIMAMTDLLTFIPDNHSKRNKILENYCSFIQGIVARQDEDGLWHHLLDRPDVYAETSCSGMFTYCILKGVNEGWLDASFLEAGVRGWKGLLSRVNYDFEITGVSPATDISKNPDYYLKPSPVAHDLHAIGPFLLSGAEYYRFRKEF